MEILRCREVLELVRLSKATVDKLEKEGRFPSRFKIGERAIAWNRADVLAWLNERAGKTEGME